MQQEWPGSLNIENSTKLSERARRVAPGGVQGAARFWEPHPLYFARGEGSRLWDVDDNEYVDLWAAAGPILLGHNDPRVLGPTLEAVEKAGVLFCLPHEREVELAEALCAEIPSGEMAVYGCGGSDVLLFGLRASRAFTGRQKIVKCEGAYHGWNDSFLVSVRPDLAEAGPADRPATVPDSSGLPPSVVEDCLVIPFNDADALEAVVSEHRGEIAAVFMEPVFHTPGCILPEPGYLAAVREICSREDIILIFDEIITGFRHAIGGFQTIAEVVPDLTAVGKAMSNGLPVSALVGRRDVMSTLTPDGDAYYSGTFMGQMLLVEASLNMLSILRDGNVHERLFSLGGYLDERVGAALDRYGINGTFQRYGSVWALYLGTRDVKDFRDVAQTGYPNDPATRAFRQMLLKNGYYFHPTTTRAYLMDAHSEADMERLADLIERFLSENKAHLQKG